MSKTVYGVSWVENIQPTKENGGATKRRMSQRFSSDQERAIWLAQEQSKESFRFVLEEWEESSLR